MTTYDCTASTTDQENPSYLYPVISSSKPLNVAEDHPEYGESQEDKQPKKNKRQAMQIDCKALQRHIQNRMAPHKHMLPMRLHQTLDDLELFLRKQDTIDLYDLLLEFNIRIDEQPAKEMIALMAVLDSEALNNLQEHDIMNAASFIRDTMEYKLVHWLLEHDKEELQMKAEKKRKE